MEKVDIEYSKRVQPFWIYGNFAGNVAKQYLYFQLPYGYGYFMRRITARWNESIGLDNAIPPTLGAVMSPELNIEIYVRGNSVQNIAIPLSLITSPGRSGFSSPNVTALHGIDYENATRTGYKILNIFLPYSDNIHLEITGQASGTPQPAFFDLMAEGYFVPENLPGQRSK